MWKNCRRWEEMKYDLLFVQSFLSKIGLIRIKGVAGYKRHQLMYAGEMTKLVWTCDLNSWVLGAVGEYYLWKRKTKGVKIERGWIQISGTRSHKTLHKSPIQFIWHRKVEIKIIEIIDWIKSYKEGKKAVIDQQK